MELKTKIGLSLEWAYSGFFKVGLPKKNPLCVSTLLPTQDELRIGTPVTLALENVHTNSGLP